MEEGRKPLQRKGFGKGQLSAMAASLAGDLNTTRWLCLGMPVPYPLGQVASSDSGRGPGCLRPLAPLGWSQGWPFPHCLHPVPHSSHSHGGLLNLLEATARSRACSTGRVPECQEAGGPACSPGGCTHLASLKAICLSSRDGHVGVGWVAGSHS